MKTERLQSSQVILTPQLCCTFTKESNKFETTYSGRVTLDSGAVLSVIHESMLMQCEHEFTGERKREYTGAGGNRLKLKDEVADVK